MAFVKNRSLWCKTGMGSLRFPTYGELEDKGGLFRFLFTIDETDYFLALDADGSARPAPAWEDWDYVPIFALMRMKPREEAFAALFACALGAWYGLNRSWKSDDSGLIEPVSGPGESVRQASDEGRHAEHHARQRGGRRHGAPLVVRP